MVGRYGTCGLVGLCFQVLEVTLLHTLGNSLVLVVLWSNTFLVVCATMLSTLRVVTLLPQPQMAQRMNEAALTVLNNLVDTLSPYHVHPSEYLVGLLQEPKRTSTITASDLTLGQTTASSVHFIMEPMQGNKWESIKGSIKKHLKFKLSAALSPAVDIARE